MMILALTGGIASGKSTVANILAEHGVEIIDTDVIAREIVEPGQPAYDEIVTHFGHEVCQNDGNLNRAALREKIFQDPAERQWLESVTHPRIRETVSQRLEKSSARVTCIVIPLLNDRTTYSMVDQIIVVDIDETTQLQRLVERDDIDETLAKKMITAQLPRRERLKLADHIIDNAKSRDDLRGQCTRLLDSLPQA